jgi:threonine/homoserine/homoserine lactone efflux protein
MNGAFIMTSLVLVALPGPNLVYIVTRAATQGRVAGLVSAAGVETATLVHVAAAALGVSAVVAAMPGMLTWVRVAGAGYLAWLAVRALISGIRKQALPPAPLIRIYREAMLVNLLNPKVLLFFLAFLPQFTTPDGGRSELLGLGAVFVTLAFCLDVTYALVGGMLRRWSPRYLAAAVYFGLAGYTMLTTHIAA